MQSLFRTSIFALALILVGTGCTTTQTASQQVEGSFSLELRKVERPDDPYIESHQEIDLTRMVDGEQHVITSLGMQLGGCHDHTVFLDEFLFDDSFQEVICSGEGAVNVYALGSKEEGVQVRGWSMQNIVGEMTDEENFTLESDWFIPLETSKVSISGLAFDLLEGMSVAYIDDDTAILNVPHSQYEVTVPFEVKMTDIEPGAEDYLETTDAGIDIYSEVCAPSYGCRYLEKDGEVYLAVFEMATSNEPVPENLDGVWFPSMEVDSEVWFEIIRTAK